MIHPFKKINVYARKKLVNMLLGNNAFTVVSNNCWGAHIYIKSGRAFTTPFVGLYLMPHSYLSLLRSWNELIHEPVVFVKESSDPLVEKIRRARSHNWPIGRIGTDVEIQFLHYSSNIDAHEKWKRRVDRMTCDPNRIFFKFDDRDGATEDQLSEFSEMPHRNKVVFTSSSKAGIGRVVIPNCIESVPDGLELSKISYKYFDACAWISGRRMRPGTICSIL